MKSTDFAGDFKFLFFTQIHPFNGFYELRFRRKRNWLLIIGILLVLGAEAILKARYSGFLIRGITSAYLVNNWFTFIAAIFPFFVFALANWSVTTIFGGNGSLGDVLMVLAYALIPKLLTGALFIFISNLVVSEELVFLIALDLMGTVYFCFLCFAGLCVIHEYSAAKNIITIAATVLAAVVIIFIGMLYFEVMGKIVSFFSTILNELLKRR